jgi:soluble lytic murein transglycosylase-like protein
MLGAVVLSPSTLEPIVTEMGIKYNVEPALIKAHIKQESNWDVNASRFEAHKGDASWGLMQLLLSTAREVLGNSNLTTTQLIQPRVNIEAGTKFIAQLQRRFGNMRDAIAAYNAGSPRLGKDGKYVNQDYVDKVTKNYELYKTLGTAAGNVAIEATSESAITTYALLGVGLLGVVILSKSEA